MWYTPHAYVDRAGSRNDLVAEEPMNDNGKVLLRQPKSKTPVVKGRFKVIGGLDYNPDAEFDFTPRNQKGDPDFTSPMVRFLGDLQHNDKVGVQGIILERNFWRQETRRVAIKSRADLLAKLDEADKKWTARGKLLESLASVHVSLAEYTQAMGDPEKAKEVDKKLREAVGDTFDVGDPTDAGQRTNVLDEYLPLLGGPFSKQLYLFDYLDQHRKAFHASTHNPIAKRVLTATRQFVLGRGVKAVAKNPEVQRVWDQFAKAADLDRRLEEWCYELSRDGEIMVRKVKNPLTYDLQVRSVDPSTVWEIVTEPEDIEQVYYFHQQFPTQYQVFYSGPQVAPATMYVIHQIPAEDVIHVKINASHNEKRGRSDLFAVLGWLKRWKDYNDAQVIRAIGLSSYVWKVKLKGNTADVKSFQTTYGNDYPKPGSLWVENEAVELMPMAMDMPSQPRSLQSDFLLETISIGTEIPKEYLGLGDQVARATALVATEPGVKKFQERQQVMERLLHKIADWVIECAKERGDLPATQPPAPLPETIKKMVGMIRSRQFADAFWLLKDLVVGTLQDEPLDTTIEFMFPEIAVEDRSAKLRDLTVMVSQGWLSGKTAAEMSAKEMGITTYNHDDEQDQIEKERAARTAQDGDDFPPPGYFAGVGTPKANLGLKQDDVLDAKADART